MDHFAVEIAGKDYEVQITQERPPDHPYYKDGFVARWESKEPIPVEGLMAERATMVRLCLKRFGAINIVNSVPPVRRSFLLGGHNFRAMHVDDADVIALWNHSTDEPRLYPTVMAPARSAALALKQEADLRTSKSTLLKPLFAIVKRWPKLGIEGLVPFMANAYDTVSMAGDVTCLAWELRTMMREAMKHSPGQVYEHQWSRDTHSTLLMSSGHSERSPCNMVHGRFTPETVVNGSADGVGSLRVTHYNFDLDGSARQD